MAFPSRSLGTREDLEINKNLKNFKSWYVDILEGLYPNREAGFVILMVAFPLLERYLREKSGIHEGKLNLYFYDELLHIFPELNTKDNANQFWHVYRNGLLHQVTIRGGFRDEIQLPKGWVSNDFHTLEIDKSGNFWVHPAKFVKRVVEVIESDFITFEGRHSENHPLPVIKPYDLFKGTSVP